MPASPVRKVTPGQPSPPGATCDTHGVNFALFSDNAQSVDLILINDLCDESRNEIIPMIGRSESTWHCHVSGLKPGQRYGFRVHGDYEPAKGHRFNQTKLLLDPYARLVEQPNNHADSLYGYDLNHPNAINNLDSLNAAPRGVVTSEMDDISHKERPAIPWEKSIIYETHIKSMTARHPELPPELRGTYSGFSSHPIINHLKELGVTTIELMPVQLCRNEDALVKRGLVNFWGYNPLSFFMPDSRYCATDNPLQEFREMVKTLHQAGLEVILDMVFNHTCETDEAGPTLFLRGIDNLSYYLLEPEDLSRYLDLSGCGNVLNINHPMVTRLLMDSLRFWADKMGVDGFRFDLAGALGLTPDGFSSSAPFFKQLTEDPVLSKLKLIAEPWLFGKEYCGKFPENWREWNGHFRNCSRRYFRGDKDVAAELATRIAGSEDLYGHRQSGVLTGINYITAHDGFTLTDLVSYNKRHNELNGDNNHDGPDENFSWNCGFEGASSEPEVIELRAKQKRNFLSLLLLSQGVPMLLGGDELGWSRKGNNNAYCQEQPINYYNWETIDQELLNLTRRLIALRHRLEFFRRQRFMIPGDSDVTWLSPDGSSPEGDEWHTLRAFGLCYRAEAGLGNDLLLLLNPEQGEKRFSIENSFKLILDTARTEIENLNVDTEYCLASHSLAIFERLPDHHSQIEKLCKIYGVANSYTDTTGKRIDSSLDTKLTLLEKLGVAAPDFVAASTRLISYNERSWLEILPPVIILSQAMKEAQFPLHLPVTQQLETYRGELRGENGDRFELEFEHQIDRFIELNGVRYLRLNLTLSKLPPSGYYDLSLTGITSSARLIVAPDTCYSPGEMRLTGISIQLYALRSDQNMGIGEFGDLEELIGCGFDVIALSPLHHLFPEEPDRRSPYSPSSRLFINPAYLSLSLIEEWTNSPAAARFKSDKFQRELSADKSEHEIDYARILKRKYQLLEELFIEFLAKHYQQNSRRGRLFAAYERLAGEELTELAELDASRNSINFEHARAAIFYKYLQWNCYLQLKHMNRKLKRAGIKLNLDLAVGVTPDGAEARNGELFVSEAEIGAPPDEFAREGQGWGLLPLHPVEMRTNGYQHFIKLLRANMVRDGLLRIDHVMQLSRLYWKTHNQKSGEKVGGYIRYPLIDLMAILSLESHRRRCAVIGEDLGTVPHDFSELLNRNNILSTRVLYFEKDGNRFKTPKDYPFRSVAALNTHDLPTLTGYFQGNDLKLNYELGKLDSAHYNELLKERRSNCRLLLQLLNSEGLPCKESDQKAPPDEEFYQLIFTLLARSNSQLILVSLHDLFMEERQPNLPGSVDEYPNWKLRYRSELKDLKIDLTFLKFIKTLRQRPD